ncbi:MAG: NusG domain II-containing protein [Firmicutes bacterium]|nr:NusG domain II-containing protein [Bacillota bacterium]
MKQLFRLLTVYDVLLAVFFLAAAAAMLLWWVNATATSGDRVVVTRNGQIIGEYPLAEDAEIELEWQGHRNLLVIQDHRAYMKEANCPDGYCLRQGPVSRRRETIVCLPAKLAVTVTGDGKGDIDAVSR